MQVERADVNLNLPGLIRFLLAHFRDVPLLKEYLEICKFDNVFFYTYSIHSR